MRFLAILALLAAIYYFAVRPKTTPEPLSAAPSPTPVQTTNALKRPIDAAKSAIDASNRRSRDDF